MLSLNTLRKPFLSALVLLGFLLLTACPDGPEPPQRDTTIRISVVNTGVTSVSLNVSVEDTTDSWTFGLARNDSIVLSAEVAGADTVVHDGGLDPSTTYRYRAYWLKNGEAADSSVEVLATTLDTTSHHFSWTIDTLGAYGSYLNDVAIIDENNVWVVGYIKTDSGTFNAARWNGTEWELVLIDRVVDFDGVFAFSEDEIWFSDGCFIYEYDGSVFSKKWECDWETYGPGQVKNIWGSSTNDIYFVGNSGSIVHYDGSGFTKMESGTPFDLHDIWGVDNKHIWVVGFSAFSTPYGEVMLSWNGYGWDKVYEAYWGEVNTNAEIADDVEGISGHSVWTTNPREVYIAGFAGNFKYIPDSTKFVKLDDPHTFVQYKLRGNTPRDFITVGLGSEVSHYNGLTWYMYPELKALFNGSIYWYSVDVKGDLVVVCGHPGFNHGIVAIGRR